MRRLWIAAALLAALAGLALWNASRVDSFVTELSADLTQAEEQAGDGNWDEAALLTRQAFSRWQERSFFLHATLRHSDLDAIQVSFRETLGFLRCGQEPMEYASASGRLLEQLQLLRKSEAPLLENIF